MRFAVVASLIALGVASTAEAQHDFDPSGRRRAPQVRGRGRQRPPAGPRADGPDKKKPGTEELIDRYTRALLASPTSPFPLQKLGELYRARDGNLERWIADFERRAATASGDEEMSVRLALAGIYLAAQRRADAARTLEDVANRRPGTAAPLLMRAAIAERDGDRTTARRQYEAALPLVRDASERERVLRQLMLLALDTNDLAAATTHHQELVRLASGSIFVKKELAVELMNRGQFAAAEARFREVARAASGDNRALAPALKDLGESLLRQRKTSEALEVLERARAAAGGQAGIRNEILALLTDVYREQGKLAELVALLEREGGRDAARLVTLAQLLEETGAVDRAITRYREALALDGRNPEVRVRLVHLLQAAGHLDEAVREYEALVKAAPDNAEYVFELAETWLQRGERAKALALVADLERRSSDRADTLATVADFYERLEEPARALRVLERLAGAANGDPRHLVELGDRYFQAGDRARALATWRKLLVVTPSRADGLLLLGDVYLDHELQAEALETLREAVKSSPPGKAARYRKALAAALERSSNGSLAHQARYREALAIWEELLAAAGDDALLAREARTHLVSLWGILRELDAHVKPLRTKLEGAPPDLEAGRLLAEVQRRLGRIPDAVATLRRVLAAAPGDVGSLLALERTLVLARDLGGAIEVLAKLVEADPKKAREHYQRMAQHAAELYRDDDAVEYASRALELSPDDAEGHYRLAAMHRRRQDLDRAMRELRKAITKDPRLFKAHFDLAELAVSRGEFEEADRLYRLVIRSSRDEEFVVRATRLAMQLHLGRGTLDALERELLPVALSNPQKPVYRRLLVELYGNLAAPLVRLARYGNDEEGARARAELAALGARAVKPLLDALSDDAGGQARVAIEVLSHVRNKGAGPALFSFATGRAEVELRVKAMLACAGLADAALLPRYQQLLAPADPALAAPANDPVAVAATWAVVRLDDPKAEALLARLVERGGSDVRALAALGLTKKPRHAALVAKLAEAPDAGPRVRAAAAAALGELGDRGHRSVLLALAEAREPTVALAALVALVRMEVGARATARLGADAAPPEDVSALLARAFWSDELRTRKVALGALTALVVGEVRRPPRALDSEGVEGSLPAALASLVPAGYSREEEVRALTVMTDSLGRAAVSLTRSSSEGAELVARTLSTRLAELLAPPLGGTTDAALDAWLEQLTRVNVSSFASLVRHPNASLRRRAIELLARRAEPEAHMALLAALDPSDAIACRVALGALQRASGAELVLAVLGLLGHREDWTIRSRAAEVLGASEVTDATVSARVAAELERVARTDSFALVREAALRALLARAPARAVEVARALGASDEEPRVRSIAAELAARAGAGGR
ncbi:MAG: tetratricopeptide repeat protein [Deltaproteobacteria bacterium]|nr:tetratricopeptide repeat protein [Deltaproteobacteria bacterium]